MKINSFLSFILIILSCSVMLASGKTSESYCWYCKRNEAHKQMVCDTNMRFVEDYGAYYVDHKYGDDAKEKVVYLTFDAGYENGNIEKILDVLKETNTTGAFFVLSHLVLENTDLVRRMRADGHLVCNHTSTHKNLSAASFEEAKTEIQKLENVYKEAIGEEIARFFRPPEGNFSKELLQYAQTLGYKTVFWSVAYADWDNKHQMAEDAALGLLLDRIHNGAVILLHPTSSVNAKILGKLIETLQNDGYRFGNLEELVI